MMRRGLTWSLAALLMTGIATNADAAITYSTIGSTYTEDFDTLPFTPTNTSLGTSPNGWIDDTASPDAGQISVPGFYTYHPTAIGSESSPAEGGANHHQRTRIGTGSANTGAFWIYGSASSTDRALGSLAATTTAGNGNSQFIGMRIMNNTGQALNRFTLTFDGEQWRDDQEAGALLFAFSTFATDADWFGNSGFTSVPTLTFNSPVSGGTGAAVNGNVAGLSADITATVTGFQWDPGADIWLRWSDVQTASAGDDGLAIDNVRFSADAGGVGPSVINSVQSGLASDPATWSNNAVPSPGDPHWVVSGHTVTVNSPFGGTELRSTFGSTIDFSASGVHVPFLAVNAGGNVTESVGGTFSLGDPNQVTRGTMVTNQALNFSMDSGSDFILSMNLLGTGDLNFQSNGAGSDLVLLDAGNHGGTIRFNGTGDTVVLPLAETYNILEMNSTGANTLDYNGTANTTNTGTAIFNEPGRILHSSNGNRLQGPGRLVANADVEVDLSTTFAGTTPNERRFNITISLQGNGNITAVGTSFDPTSGSVTKNEFELGSTPQPASVVNSTYSGTISSQDYVDMEIRHNIRGGKIVVNANGRLETGHQRIPTTLPIHLGEVEVMSGGTLEVGFEEDDSHNAAILNLVNTHGRSGGLTLHDGATLRMQVNGTAADLFDSIHAQGDVALNGTLDVLVNPIGSAAAGNDGDDAYAAYTPEIGHTFNIITIDSTGGEGDLNGDEAVDILDYVFWRSNGLPPEDYEDWSANYGGTGGGGPTINGMFDSVTHNLPGGMDFAVHYLANAVQLEIVATEANGAGAAVPEPATCVLLGAMLPMLLSVRRRR